MPATEAFVQTVLDILVNLPIKMAKMIVQPFVDSLNTLLETYNAANS